MFVYLVSFALKLKSPTSLKWVAIAVVMLGIVLLTQIYDIGASGVTVIGVGAGLLAGLSYAIFIFGFKYAAARQSAGDPLNSIRGTRPHLNLAG